MKIVKQNSFNKKKRTFILNWCLFIAFQKSGLMILIFLDFTYNSPFTCPRKWTLMCETHDFFHILYMINLTVGLLKLEYNLPNLIKEEKVHLYVGPNV